MFRAFYAARPTACGDRAAARETALVEAQLRALCIERTNQTDAVVPPLLQSHGGTSDEVTASLQQLNRTENSSTPVLVHAIPAQGFNTAWLLVGACATALVVTIGLVVVVRRRRAQLQAILLMLLTEVGQLVLSLCMAIANLATDGIVYDSLIRGDLRVSSDIYLAAYATILCFGVVATALSMGYGISNACLVRTQLQQLAPLDQALAANEAHRQAQQHDWELVQTHRTKVTTSLSLMSVAVQGMAAKRELVRASASSPCTADLPMSILNCCLIFFEDSTDKAVRAPLAAGLSSHEWAVIERVHRWSRRFWCRW
jgi:hypothetical protein